MIRKVELLAVVLVLASSCARQAPPRPRQEPLHPVFLAPLNGEVLSEGERFVIRWQAPGWDSVNVGAVMGGKDRGHLAFALRASTDSLAWDVPKGWVTGFGIARADNVRLRLENAGDPNQFVDSAPFAVQGARP